MLVVVLVVAVVMLVVKWCIGGIASEYVRAVSDYCCLLSERLAGRLVDEAVDDAVGQHFNALLDANDHWRQKSDDLDVNFHDKHFGSFTNSLLKKLIHLSVMKILNL